MLTRRDLLKCTAGFTAASNSRILGANERVRVGFIGMGAMGSANLGECMAQPDTQITWVCDVYNPNLTKADQFAKKQWPYVRTHTDFRQVLDDQNTDAVCISTPDHWHALMAVMAMQAGKHVYIEKPFAHRINEISVMLKAAKKFRAPGGQTIVHTTGQWQNADVQFHECLQSIRNEFGPVSEVRIHLYWNEGGMGKPADNTIPQGLGEWGWNMWLGPAPYHAFDWNRFNLNPALTKEWVFSRFRYYADHANGILGDWGPHTMHEAQSYMDSVGPRFIESVGRIESDDDRDLANIWRVVCDYDNGYANGRGHNHPFRVIWDHNSRKDNPDGKKRNWAIAFFGPDGDKGPHIEVDRNSSRVFDASDKLIDEIKTGNKPGTRNWRNFIKCIRFGGDTYASFYKTAPATATCLAAAALWRAYAANGGKTMLWDPQKLQTPDENVSPYLEYHYHTDRNGNKWQMPNV